MASFGSSKLESLGLSTPLATFDPVSRMKTKSSAPLGIFDSGVGGITVLQELYRQLPQESIVYFGDTARLPYGDRSPQQIVQYVREILNWMTLQGVKMVIMACNTSSALALEQVRSDYPFPILGVILPGANAAAQTGRRIGVLATPATASSHAYRQAILKIDPQSLVWEVGCPEFVPLIEANRLDEAYTYQIVSLYTSVLLDQRIDTLIYGCTHYPHLSPILETFLPATVQTINPAIYVVSDAIQELDRLGLRQTDRATWTRFYVSGSTDRFAQLASQWLGSLPKVTQVDIEAYGTSLKTSILPCLNDISEAVA